MAWKEIRIQRITMKHTKPNQHTETSPENLAGRKELKTILIAGDDKGGVGKSTSVAHLGDALTALGYQVRLADGDRANRTLRSMVPNADSVDGHSADSIRDYVAGSASGDHQITILDMAGGTGSFLAEVFGDGVQIFEPDGVRVVVALVFTEHPKSVRGAMNWIRAFIRSAEFLGLANGKDSPLGKSFDISRVEGGSAIQALCKGRIIEVPRLPSYIEPLFVQKPGPPSAYFMGGRLEAPRHFQKVAWHRQLDQVVESLLPHAEWLVGTAPPTERPAPADHASVGDDEVEETLRKLRALYGDEND
jgi:hypothetical protein